MEEINLDLIRQFTGNYQYSSEFLILNQKYIFKFNILTIFSCQNTKHKYFQFIQNVSTYFMSTVFLPQKHQQLIKQSIEIKKLYCQINRLLKTNRKIEHLDILLFLTTLLIKEIFRRFSNKYCNEKIKTQSKAKNETIEQKKQQIGIQPYTYMILIHQTTGNLINPQTFNILKQKYIKETIFRPENVEKNFRYVLSLKHLNDKLNDKTQRHLLTKTRKANFQKSELKILFQSDLKVSEKSSCLNVTSSVDRAQKIFSNLLNDQNTIPEYQPEKRVKTIPSSSHFKQKNYNDLSIAIEYCYSLKKNNSCDKKKWLRDKTFSFQNTSFDSKRYKDEKKIAQNSVKEDFIKDDQNLNNNQIPYMSKMCKKWKKIVHLMKKNSDNIPKPQFSNPYKSKTSSLHNFHNYPRIRDKSQEKLRVKSYLNKSIQQPLPKIKKASNPLKNVHVDNKKKKIQRKFIPKEQMKNYTTIRV